MNPEVDMTRLTLEQISAQIAALQKIKPRVRHYSLFGADHHAAIDAQIQVLEGRMDNDEIYDEKEKAQWPDSVLEAALDARRWLDGEYEDATDLVASWKELAR
jgi:hypothetical protein